MLGGLIRGIYRPRAPRDPAQFEGARVLMHGSGVYGVEIVIGSIQKSRVWATDDPCRANDGGRQIVAVLRLDDVDRSHWGSVGVHVEGVRMGCLPSWHAAPFREWLDAWNLTPATILCRGCMKALPGTPERVRLFLDLDVPFGMTLLEA